MDQRTIGLYLSRILSGYLVFLYNNQLYKLIYPDINIRYNAEIYVQEIYDTIKYNDWINEDDILGYLINIGLWPHNGDDILKKLETQIEDNKVDQYKNFINPAKIKTLKRTLSNIKRTYNRYYNTRHSMDQFTTSGYTDLLKNYYILVNSLYDNNNNLVFNSIENSDYNLLNHLTSVISDYSIEMSTYRTIARSEQWKNYWNANSDNLFGKPTIHWTDEQKTLVVITKMYDSAFSHPECPQEKIINDDDMFDGWLIYQKRESDQIKNKNRTEKLLVGKGLDKANEVYIMAQSNDEVQNIHDLNNASSKFIIKERNDYIANAKEVEDSKLPDIAREILVKSNEQFKNNFRK